MREIWNKTQQRIVKYDDTYQESSGEIIMTFWWILFIVSGFVGHFVLRTAFDIDTIEQIIYANKGNILLDSLHYFIVTLCHE